MEKKERIAKVLARAGVCSRREAERWIAMGRIQVDHQVITKPDTLVDEKTIIHIDGRLMPPIAAPRLWCYHKPAGLVTTHHDPQGRPTVFEKLPPSLPRVISVGRLDLNSEGLLLLTNDGALSRALELPSNHLERCYRVRVKGRVDPGSLERLKKGITIKGIHYGPIIATIEKQMGSNAWVHVILHEGKNREIRRVMEHLGWQVNRLIRLSYGLFKLDNLKQGEVKEIPASLIAKQLKAIQQ